jgi:hypothetical protein
MFYIEGGYFYDNKETNGKNKNIGNDKPLYVIYDKEEQAKIEARWERMHGKIFH